MSSIIASVFYFIVLLLLVNSKLKTGWIIFTSFMAGYSICYYSNDIINLIK